MGSNTIITKRNHSKDIWRWEIQDLFLHFRFYESYSASYFDKLESDVFTAGEGTSKHSSWKVLIQTAYVKDKNYQLQVGLHFLGLEQKTLREEHTVYCFYEFIVSNSGGDETPLFTSKKNSTFTYYYTKNGAPDERYADSYQKFTDVMPLTEFCTKRTDLFPDDKLNITVKMTIRLDPIHSTPEGTAQSSLDPKLELFEPLESFYGGLINNKKFSDVQIHCPSSTSSSLAHNGQLSEEGSMGSLIYAHKFILSARSSVFCAMLQAPMKEKEENVIRIEGMDVETVELMLQYIYVGQVKIPLDKIPLLQLLDCAEKYDLEELKSACFSKMVASISDDNAGEFALAAYNYNVHGPGRAIIQDYCARRHSILIKNPEYKKLFLQTPTAFIGDAAS